MKSFRQGIPALAGVAGSFSTKAEYEALDSFLPGNVAWFPPR